MSEEKTAIEKLYDDPKSRNFVNHLIMSYLPIHKATKVLGFEDNLTTHKCNVCNHELIDASTVITRMHDSKEYMSDTIEHMMKGVRGEEVAHEDIPIIKHITHGAIMAWTGEKTNTYLCLDCVKGLLEMVTNKLLQGDKNIIWITSKMRRSEVFNHFTENPILDEAEKEKVHQIQKAVEKKKTVTFGDLDVLQKLKAKMEAEQDGK
jgi:hypothetical protein